jgi:ribonuclease HII
MKSSREAKKMNRDIVLPGGAEQTNELSASVLKAWSDELASEQWPQAAEVLKRDARKAVYALGIRLEKKMDNQRKEEERLRLLFSFEDRAQTNGFFQIAGIDEVGRGPLIGPVVAACVILDRGQDWSGVDDSKKLSEKKREMLYEKIVNHSVYGIGSAEASEINEINILNATKMAMKRAIEDLAINFGGMVPDYLLIDAVKLADISIKQEAIIKGDSKSASIAAASIVAKVTRDRMMAVLHEIYPEYDFINNKGYGTPQHYKALEMHGMLDEHRRSFLKNFSQKRG